MTTWGCKIGIKGDLKLPPGADSPLREAIKEVFKKFTGKDHDFCFSGWSCELTETEKEIIDEKSSR